jgi:hypothetical protein
MDHNTCAEVEYDTNGGMVHSDICGDITSDEWRDTLHRCLDEWLRNSNGTGRFVVGDTRYMWEEKEGW